MAGGPHVDSFSNTDNPWYHPATGQLDTYQNPLLEQATAMPFWYDINGEKHVNYAYGYGPHAGVTCNCPACKEFNEGYQDQQEINDFRRKTRDMASEQLGRYVGSSSHGLHGGYQIDAYAAVHIVEEITFRLVKEYQEMSMARFRKMQMGHTQLIAQLRSQIRLAKAASTAPSIPDARGRLFKEGDTVAEPIADEKTLP